MNFFLKEKRGMAPIIFGVGCGCLLILLFILFLMILAFPGIFGHYIGEETVQEPEGSFGAGGEVLPGPVEGDVGISCLTQLEGHSLSEADIPLKNGKYMAKISWFGSPVAPKYCRDEEDNGCGAVEGTPNKWDPKKECWVRPLGCDLSKSEDYFAAVRYPSKWWEHQKLLVINPKNDKKVVVEILDKGPDKKKSGGRHLDLSWAAYTYLGVKTDDWVQVCFASRASSHHSYAPIPGGKCSLPVRGMQLKRYSHHDYSASDIGPNWGVTTGADILAVKSGTIRSAGWLDNKCGWGITLWDPQFKGVYYIYCHLSAIYVKTGQKVKTGQVIGKLGYSGNANSRFPHLHFAVRVCSGTPRKACPGSPCWTRKDGKKRCRSNWMVFEAWAKGLCNIDPRCCPGKRQPGEW